MPLSTGTRLGPCEILAPLGVGGMGDPDGLRRFESEARADSALIHPNTCVLHDIGAAVPDDGGMPWWAAVRAEPRFRAVIGQM